MTYEEESEFEEQNQDTNQFEDTEEQRSSEDANNNITATDFDPERVLYEIQKALLGYSKRNNVWVRVSEPLARTEFITLYISSIRALVNFPNMFSVVPSEEAGFNMLESLKEITYAAVDFGIEEEHLETLINMYDTIKNTFYGIIIEGRGTENVKQVLTSVYKDISSVNDANTNKAGLVNWQEVNKYLKK